MDWVAACLAPSDACQSSERKKERKHPDHSTCFLGINWAKEYFKRSFQVDATGSLKLTLNLETVTGDCDLNQRKSQIISIFDMAIKGSWKV